MEETNLVEETKIRALLWINESTFQKFEENKTPRVLILNSEPKMYTFVFLQGLLNVVNSIHRSPF